MSEQPDLMVLPASALKARRKSKKHGHAAMPGTGPSGETCGTCEHLARKHISPPPQHLERQQDY